jgi:hypothetical protein
MVEESFSTCHHHVKEAQMHQRPVFVAVLVLLTTAFFVTGCTTMSPKPANVNEVTCVSGPIEWDVAPEAEIQTFGCALGTHEGDPSLIFTVALKNVSDTPHRFRLTIFLDDMDKGIAYYVPVKGSPPAVPPGEVQSVKIPFMKTTTLSKKMSVTVTAVD